MSVGDYNVTHTVHMIQNQSMVPQQLWFCVNWWTLVFRIWEFKISEPMIFWTLKSTFISCSQGCCKKNGPKKNTRDF